MNNFSTISETTNIHYPKMQISGKVGSLETRNFQIRKPQLKVGRE